MVHTYGNHPSFCMMTLGNEYGQSDDVLTRWIDMLIREDPRHLYSSPSSGQMTENRQYTERDAVGIRGPGTDCDRRELVPHLDGRPSATRSANLAFIRTSTRSENIPA